MALNEYGIEGMGVVSTRADEGRATISPDGQRIVFARRGEAGWGLWEARGRHRWQQAQALPVGAWPVRSVIPTSAGRGRWRCTAPHSPPPGLARTAGDGDRREERGPALSVDGKRLLFARQQGRGAGWDLLVATLDAQGVRGPATALTALNSGDDETDGDWLGNDGAVVFSRGSGTTAQVWSSGCAWSGAPAAVGTVVQPDRRLDRRAGDRQRQARRDAGRQQRGEAPRAGGVDVPLGGAEDGGGGRCAVDPRHAWIAVW